MKNNYIVATSEPQPLTDEHANLDNLNHNLKDPDNCPLCDSVYIGIMSHKGSFTKFLECFLGHCIQVEWYKDGKISKIEITDKPRITIGMSYSFTIYTHNNDNEITETTEKVA